VPNEFLEAYFPLRVEKYETVADSGGPGLHRGGNGIDIAYRFLEPGEVSIHDDRWFTYPWGVNGGLPGGRSRKYIERMDGTVEILQSKCDRIKVNEGDLLHYITWGGGGWGDPLMREPEVVAQEVECGLVTVEGARHYGVVLQKDGRVNHAATTELRGRMRATRDALQVFNFGPSLRTLRERCLDETGLPPPNPPQFARFKHDAGKS
jgi:N-methylhydantoinase B